MRKGYNVPIWSTFIIILIALDQLTKFLIVKSLEVGESIKVISNFYILHLIETKVLLGDFTRENVVILYRNNCRARYFIYVL